MSRDLELEQQIDAYLKGKLNEEEAHELWAKLLERPDYIELLETELGVKSILAERSVNNKSDSSSAEEQSIIYHLKASKKWIAAAAAVAVLVVAINFLQMNTTNNIGDLALKDINIAENLSSAQILRSQEAEIEPADSLLNRGFEAAISGDVDKALKYYDLIIESHSESASAVKAYLNKGIIQYNSGSFEESITSFESVLDKVSEKPIVREKAYWYLGNALINLNELKEAREAIHTTYAIDGIYRKPAFRLLKKLDHELGNDDVYNVEQQLKEE